ncbi:hypothetical protein CDD83_10703 [Cordyceps sp. RAO-2017]|nr:hypothetical protein CDD83_10703 [Cordyceps sp. RAO-2017]
MAATETATPCRDADAIGSTELGQRDNTTCSECRWPALGMRTGGEGRQGQNTTRAKQHRDSRRRRREAGTETLGWLFSSGCSSPVSTVSRLNTTAGSVGLLDRRRDPFLSIGPSLSLFPSRQDAGVRAQSELAAVRSSWSPAVDALRSSAPSIGRILLLQAVLRAGKISPFQNVRPPPLALSPPAKRLRLAGVTQPEKQIATVAVASPQWHVKHRAAIALWPPRVCITPMRHHAGPLSSGRHHLPPLPVRPVFAVRGSIKGPSTGANTDRWMASASQSPPRGVLLFVGASQPFFFFEICPTEHRFGHAPCSSPSPTLACASFDLCRCRVDAGRPQRSQAWARQAHLGPTKGVAEPMIDVDVG